MCFLHNELVIFHFTTMKIMSKQTMPLFTHKNVEQTVCLLINYVTKIHWQCLLISAQNRANSCFKSKLWGKLQRAKKFRPAAFRHIYAGCRRFSLRLPNFSVPAFKIISQNQVKHGLTDILKFFCASLSWDYFLDVIEHSYSNHSNISDRLHIPEPRYLSQSNLGHVMAETQVFLWICGKIVMMDDWWKFGYIGLFDNLS